MWTKMNISLIRGSRLRGKVKKNGCIESFNYGELNKKHERRDTECNHIIYHPKLNISGSGETSTNI